MRLLIENVRKKIGKYICYGSNFKKKKKWGVGDRTQKGQ